MSSGPPRLAPVLVLGLDGATFDVIDPLIAAGRLPNLAAMRRDGVALPLESTVPPTSFPAWSTFMTGLSPGRHGLFDFTQKVPGAYRIRFANATDRRGETIFGRVSRAGGRCLALGMPATFPPEDVNGLLVPGFDAPVSTGSDPRCASNPDLYRRIAARAGPWMRPQGEPGDGAGGERAVETLLERVARKEAFALCALEELRRESSGAGPALAAIVFSESDTVAHHYWRDHDPASPRHDPAAGAARRGAIAAVYERLDAACGALRAAFGEEALCVVVSDHGAGGASRRVVHLNRFLAEVGFLRRRGARGAGGPGRGALVPGGLDGLARGARDLALRALPPRAAQRLFRLTRSTAARVESAARFGGIDWRRTAAFSEEANTQPGVWINLKGREAAGCVEPADYERVRAELIAALLEWKLPGGQPVVERARRREEVHAGPCCDRAPDVVVELALDAGYGLSLVQTPWADGGAGAIRELADDELAGGRGRGMNGTHRPEGVWIATGPTAEPVEGARTAALCDAAPTLIRAIGLPWEGELDGSAIDQSPVAYTDEEEARVAERLRALGYLE